MTVEDWSTQLQSLPVRDRLRLVQDLWESIARDSADLPVPEALQTELDRRKQAHLAAPESACSWEELKQSLLAAK